jgi:hypothetical protein
MRMGLLAHGVELTARLPSDFGIFGDDAEKLDICVLSVTDFAPFWADARKNAHAVGKLIRCDGLTRVRAHQGVH